MDTRISTRLYQGILNPLLGSWLVLFHYSVLASDDREQMTALMAKAERMAVREVLSPSNRAFFEAFESIPLLGFITPMNVMGPEIRDRIRQHTVSIIRSDLEQIENGQSSRLQATREQLAGALQNVKASRSMEMAPDWQLVQFRQYIRENSIQARDTNGGVISLYKASLILKRWGVDPYDFEAHPYYCALGIKALDTMNVYTTRFCS